jgi:hypothetical protein
VLLARSTARFDRLAGGAARFDRLAGASFQVAARARLETIFSRAARVEPARAAGAIAVADLAPRLVAPADRGVVVARARARDLTIVVARPEPAFLALRARPARVALALAGRGHL